MKFPYTDARMMQLQSVNVGVNDSTTYTTDQVQFGVIEYWIVAGKRGDCEDYALAKMQKLRALGWPKECLNIGICYLGDEGHAVLIAETDKADFILDNNNDKVVTWDKTPYRWLEKSVDGDFRKWVAIEG
jgi:predicted transglutaminase-like cysteine proteinase